MRGRKKKIDLIEKSVKTKSKKEKKIKIFKKEKKIKIEEINPEIVSMLEEPSEEFCRSCVSSDMRIIKDNLNMSVITLHMVAMALDINYDNIPSLCEKIRKWANKEVNHNRNLLMRKTKIEK